MRLTTFDHASPISSDPKLTASFFEKFVGLKNSFSLPDPDERDTTIMAVGNDARGRTSSATSPPRGPARGNVGSGSVHHVAMAVEDDRDQLKIKRHLDDVGIGNSGIIDRFWFHSLYFRDPDGNLLEVATKGPGYAVDETPETLGSRLVLPKWVEPRRSEIEAFLQKTDEGNPVAWPPSLPGHAPNVPEALTQPS